MSQFWESPDFQHTEAVQKFLYVISISLAINKMLIIVQDMKYIVIFTEKWCLNWVVIMNISFLSKPTAGIIFQSKFLNLFIWESVSYSLLRQALQSMLGYFGPCYKILTQVEIVYYLYKYFPFLLYSHFLLGSKWGYWKLCLHPQ